MEQLLASRVCREREGSWDGGEGEEAEMRRVGEEKEDAQDTDQGPEMPGERQTWERVRREDRNQDQSEERRPWEEAPGLPLHPQAPIIAQGP